MNDGSQIRELLARALSGQPKINKTFEFDIHFLTFIVLIILTKWRAST
jgi:hypothetical protein